MMLSFLAVVITVGILAYDHYTPYEGDPYSRYYQYGEGQQYYEDQYCYDCPYDDCDNYENGYINEDNNYIDDYYINNAPNYIYRTHDFVALDDEMVHISVFEIFDEDLGLLSHGDYVYRIDDDLNALRIGPRMGIMVIFDATGGDYDPGDDIRLTNLGTSTVGQIGYAPLIGMPPAPRGVGMRIFMGWNTQQNGLGDVFTGTSDVHAINSPLTVYAQWGFQVTFSGAGLPSGGTGPGDPNYYGPRIIREGWNFVQAAASPWHDVAWPNNPPNLGAFVFQGWYNAPVGGTPWNSTLPITANMGLHARWPAAFLPVVTFDTQGGFLGTPAPAPPAPVPGGFPQTLTRQARPGLSINISSAPPPEFGVAALNPDISNRRSAPEVIWTDGSRTLEGWWTSPGGWDVVDNERFASPGSAWDGSGTILPIPAAWADTPVNEDMVVYAHWVYRVIFNPNVGGPGGGGGPRHPLPGPDYFYNAQLFNNAWTFGPTGALPLFRDVRLTDVDPTIGTHGIQRNIFTDEPEERRCIPDETYVTRPGHRFNGWWIMPAGTQAQLVPHTDENFPLSIGAIPFDEDTVITSSMTVWAHWIPADTIDVVFHAGEGHFYRNLMPWGTYPPVLYGTNTHIVRFSASPQDPGTINAATCGPNCTGQPGQPPGSGHPGTRSITMPTHPRRDGYVFIGWFSNPCPGPYNVPATAADRGAQFPSAGANTVTFLAGTLNTEDRTVHAHWAPYITLIFDPNGGVPAANSGPATWQRPAGVVGQPAPNHPSPAFPAPAGSHAPYRRIAVGSWSAGNPFTMATLNGNTGAAGTVNGAMINHTLSYGNFGITRPGFTGMQANWAWPWFHNSIDGGHGNAIWHTTPYGNSPGRAIAATTHTTIMGALADANRELRVYLQWGQEITFDPNLGTVPGRNNSQIIPQVGSPHHSVNPTFYQSRIFQNFAANYSFNTRLREYNHPTSPATGGATFVPDRWTGGHMFTPPYMPPYFHAVAPLSPITQVFPNPCLAANGGNWPQVTTALAGSNATFVGWNTSPLGNGAWLGPNTLPCSILPIADANAPGGFRRTLYAIWDVDSLSFSCGLPCAGHGVGGCNPSLCEEFVTPHRIPITPGVTIWNSITTWPADPTPPTGFDEVFIGWQNAAGMWLDEAVQNQNVAVHAAMHFYARWGTPIFFETNGGVFSGGATMAQRPANVDLPIPQPQLDSIGTPTRATDWRFGRWNVQRSGLGAPIIGAAPPGVTGSPVSGDIPTYAGNQNRRTVFAQWDGVFNFNLNGGQIGVGAGSTNDRQVWVPEGFSIHQTSNATNLPANLPPSPAPNSNISNLAAVPNNPTHPDPSMVFVGWRVVGGPLDGQFFYRTGVDGVDRIIMNGYVDPTDDDCEDTNAPNGRINLIAVWEQRLVFTKTGELLYLTYPDTDNSNRVREPRNGAEFRLYRNTGTIETPIWTAIVNSVTSGAVANLNAVGNNTGNTPFAGPIPNTAQPGLVVINIPTRVSLTPGGQYRLMETEPPPGYMREGGYWLINIHPVSTHPDARINTITTGAHHPDFPNILPFVDWNLVTETPRTYLLQDWHVGNLRPRLVFTKLDRDEEPLCGARFIVERLNTVTNEWEALADAYQPLPSGSAIPLFPGQTPHPIPAPPAEGIVVVPRPFPHNSTGQYRLREVGVPAGSGYLIPTGHWNIVTNVHGGVSNLNAVGAALSFVVINAHQDDPNQWNVGWSITNTPTRFWPFLKTDQFLNSSTPHSYLPGAEFRLFVYNGPGEPDNVLITADMVIPPPTTPMPGTWSFVWEDTSSDGTPPAAMWFPMMPGRYYQLVEILAPVGFQVPWSQWRISVTGAVSAATIQGTGLSRSVVSSGVGNDATNIVLRENHTIAGGRTPNCDPDSTPDYSPRVTTAFLISNRPDLQLPMAGGTGVVLFTAIGSSMAGLGIAFFYIKHLKGKRLKATA